MTEHILRRKQRIINCMERMAAHPFFYIEKEQLFFFMIQKLHDKMITVIRNESWIYFAGMQQKFSR